MHRIELNRRTLFGKVLGAAAATAGLTTLGFGGFKHPLGAQLYTVRSVIGKNEEEILKRIAALGYTELETTGRDNLEVLSPILTKYRLKVVSTHLDVPVITGKWPDGAIHPTLAQAIETAKKYGVQYLVFPYVPPPMRGNADGYRALADQLNEAGAQCHKASLTLAYHNHAFEFGGAQGERPIDILNGRLDKKLVFFELDLFWVSVAGHDPVKILKEYKGRAPLIHLKDKKAGTPVMFDERVPKETFQEVGSGELNFPEILRTAESMGAKHYFVEQDQTPGDPVDSLAKSYKYLRGLSL